MLRDIGHLAAGLARALLAMLAGLLPRRRWDAFDLLPVRRMSGLSALATFATGAGVGIGGFFRFAAAASDGIADLTLKAAQRQSADPHGGAAMSLFPAMTASGLSPLAFVVATPAGWLASYLVISGVVRALAAWFDDPMGDPVLGGLDRLLAGGKAGLRERRTRRARERAEGPEAPDRLYPADWAGVSGADLVVVAARRKPDWTRGTFVITSDRWYTLGDSFELDLPEGLRTVYPLTEHRTGEILRRGVSYELPPLQGPPGTARPRAARDRG